MDIVAYTLAAGMIILLLLMGCLALKFMVHLLSKRADKYPHENPMVGIILPLRGSDPFLKRCLTALINQNYENYQIRVVIDNPQDPSRAIVEEVISDSNSDKIYLEYLNDFTETCSLKSCALRQGYDSLPEDCEVIVQIDADAYPYPDWIEDMVSGLQEPGVGVVCGFRWFSPTEPSLATMVRHVWNSGAALQMLHMNIGWGGAFAMSKEAFEKANIYEQWGNALFEDTYSTDLILKEGYKLSMLPRVIMINEESTTLPGITNFISRQLLNIKLYHPSWPMVFWYGIFSFILTCTSIIFACTALAMQDYFHGGIVLASVAIYFVGQAIYLWLGEWTVNLVQKSLNKPLTKYSPLYLPWSIFCTLMIYPFCLLSALKTKNVTWRGINYKIAGPHFVTRTNYEPFIASGLSAKESL